MDAGVMAIIALIVLVGVASGVYSCYLNVKIRRERAKLRDLELERRQLIACFDR